MQVGELFYLFGIKPDGSWSDTQKQVTGFINDVDRRLRGLRRVFVGAGIFGVVREVAQASDEYSNLHSRLGLVANSQEEVNALFERGRQVARDTRSALGPTIDGFTKIAQSAASLKLGLSNDEIFGRLERINKAIKISGPTTQQAKAGFTQLTQAISSNRLGGDEFRSVLENIPGVAAQLEKFLKVDRGKLRALSKAGKITAKVIMDAFGPEAAAELDAKFAKIAPTIGDAWVAFKNDMMVSLGEFSKDVGLVDALTFAFETLGTALRLVVDTVKGGVQWFKALFHDAMAGDDGATAILAGLAGVITMLVVPALFSMAAAVFTALAPFAAIFAGVALVAFGVIKLRKHWDEIKTAIVKTWEAAKQSASNFWDWLSSLPGRFVDLLSDFGDKVLAAFDNVWEAIKQGASDAFNWVSKTAREIPVLGFLGEKLGQGAGMVVNAIRGGEDLSGIDHYTQAPQVNGGYAAPGAMVNVQPSNVQINVGTPEEAKRVHDSFQADQAANGLRHAMHDVGGVAR